MAIAHFVFDRAPTSSARIRRPLAIVYAAMRVEIHLSDGGILAVGHDHAVGFFATIERAGRVREFDRLTKDYDPQRPADALLRWLVDEVYTEEDLDEALLRYPDPGEDDEPLSPGAALALQVIEALKRAAAE